MPLVWMTNLPSLKKKACIPEFNITICIDAEISVKEHRRIILQYNKISQ